MFTIELPRTIYISESERSVRHQRNNRDFIVLQRVSLERYGASVTPKYVKKIIFKSATQSAIKKDKSHAISKTFTITYNFEGYNIQNG